MTSFKINRNIFQKNNHQEDKNSKNDPKKDLINEPKDLTELTDRSDRSNRTDRGDEVDNSKNRNCKEDDSSQEIENKHRK